MFVDAALNSADADLQAGTGRERSDARDDKAMPCASIQPGERSEQEQHYRHGSAEHPMLPSEAEAAGPCGLVPRPRCQHISCPRDTSTALCGYQGAGVICVPKP